MPLSKYLFCLFFSLITLGSSAQNIDFSKNSTLGNLYIRMYGELHYYQAVSSTQFIPGKFDAKRVVVLFGYQFDRNTQFVTEWELEHANEIYLEQAFIKHKIANNMAIKAGMILVPMGIINENHEPNNFYSVDRPFLDRTLIPSTWRDIGIGINGLMPELDLRYQLYLVNGLLGYKDESALFQQSDNYRSGRQKGIKTILSGLPSLSGQLEYYGLKSGKIGLSVYFGESNTDAFKGLSKDNTELINAADSTVLLSSMTGLHYSANFSDWSLKTQIISAYNSGVEAYNAKTSTDLGKFSLGTYLEIGKKLDDDEKWLIFSRYSYLNYDVTGINGPDYGAEDHIVTTGINYFAAKGAVFKLDLQLRNLHQQATWYINSGVGVWF